MVLRLLPPSALRGQQPPARLDVDLEEGQRGYAAGVIDCDGTICIARDKRAFRLHLAVYNSREDLLLWFVHCFGGRSRKSRARSDNRSTEYTWACTNLDAVKVLHVILPYLVIKRKQALLAIEFASTLDRSQARLPQVYKDLRARAYEEMKSLNMRASR